MLNSVANMLSAIIDATLLILLSSPIGVDNTMLNSGTISYPLSKANRPFEDLFEGFIVGIYD